MPVAKTKRYLLTVAGLLLAAVTCAAPVFADTVGSIPGIVDDSLPQFVNDVTVRANRGNWTVTGHGNFTFNDGATEWAGETGSYSLKASFDSAGNFETGTVTLYGKITGLVDRRALLMTADLLSFGFDAGTDPTLVGFNINNIQCNSLLGVRCNDGLSTESVIIQLMSAFGGDVNGRFRLFGTAYTSVPLPAALLLMLSGLGLFGMTSRRRSS